MLQIENASIAYNGQLLFSGFSLHLHRSEMVGITGPSGCGKSSLLNAVLGFTPLQEGRIRVNGVLLEKGSIDLIRRQMAWIPQELALPVEWVKEMVRMPFDLRCNRSVPFSEQELMHSFEALGLECELYEKRVAEVSGGQRQRIMIAVAAMMRKPLMIMDEPTSALDADSTERVLAFLHRLTSGGTAILAVSHDDAFSAGCHRRIVMETY